MKTPLGYTVQLEPKSRRAQFLIQPSVYEAIQEIAAKNDVSVNEMVNTILRDYANEHSE